MKNTVQTAVSAEPEKAKTSKEAAPVTTNKPAFDNNLVTNTKYEAAFNQSPPDFSNMTLNEFHTIVKSVMAIEQDHENKYGSDEPVRIGKNGNPLISYTRKAMNRLSGTLEVLSFGKGSVDPNEKIDVLAYFENRVDKYTELAKNQPHIYSVRAQSSRESVRILEQYFSEQAFVEYKEKAITLLTDLEASKAGAEKNETDNSEKPAQQVDVYV